MKTTSRSRQAQQPSIPLEMQSVADLLACLAHALKQMQFYGTGAPGAQRAIEAARVVFDDVWAETDRLQCTVRANAFEVENVIVYESDGLADSLPFTFYKDGIRELIFLPGFEGAELETFLETLGRARSVRLDDDDLVTLLWERDLAFLRYGYVDASADADVADERRSATAGGDGVSGTSLQDGAGGGGGSAAEDVSPTAGLKDAIVRRLSAGAVAAEAQPRGPWDDPAALTQARTPAAAAAAARNAATILLVASEMEVIQREIEAELERDVVADVNAALLDSLEDAPEAKQAEILLVIAQFLPALLSERRWDLVVATLTDLRVMAADRRVPPVHSEAIATITAGPKMAAAVDALLVMLQRGDILPRPGAIEPLLTELGPLCFEQLVRTAEAVKNKELRATLQRGVDAIVATRIDVAYSGLASSDTHVLRAILHRLQQYPDVAHVRRMTRLLHDDDAGVREAAIRVVIVSGGRDGIPILRRALADSNSDVRIAALWGLGIWQVEDVRGELEARLQDKTLLDAPAAERMAVFEAYARIAAAGALPLLSRIVHGRAGLGRRWPAELRMCAVRVLPLTGAAEARGLLEKAVRDDDDALRRAAQRALQRMEDGR